MRRRKDIAGTTPLIAFLMRVGLLAASSGPPLGGVPWQELHVPW